MKIAVAGKGGTGKTFLAGSLAFLLARAGHTTLAIDADSAPNLGSFLGLSSGESETITPISKNDELIAAKTRTGFPGVYALNFTVDDVVRKHAVLTPSGVNLLVMGTVLSAGAGCTCPASSVVRALLRHLLVDRDEMIVLDMEAGLEHLGRGTAENVDIMLVVSDANHQSLAIAGTIIRLAREAGIPRTALVGNRIMNDAQREAIQEFARSHDIPVFGLVPFDDAVTRAGMAGDPVSALADSDAVHEVREILHRIQENRE